MPGGVKTFGSKSDKALEILDRIKTPTDKAMGGNVSDVMKDFMTNSDAKKLGSFIGTIFAGEKITGDFSGMTSQLAGDKNVFNKLIAASQNMYNEMSKDSGDSLKTHVVNISQALKSISDNLVTYLSGMQLGDSGTNGQMTYNIVIDTSHAENFDKILKEMTAFKEENVKNVEKIFDAANKLAYIDMKGLHDNFIMPMNTLTQLDNKEILETLGDVPNIITILKDVFGELSQISFEGDVEKAFDSLNAFTMSMIRYNELDLSAINELPAKLDALKSIINEGSDHASLADIFKQMNEMPDLEITGEESFKSFLKSAAYLVMISDLLDDENSKEINAAIDNLKGIIDSIKEKISFSQEDSDKVKAAMASLSECTEEMQQKSVDIQKSGTDISAAFKNYDDSIKEANVHASNASTSMTTLIDTYKTSAQSLKEAQAETAAFNFNEISTTINDLGSTILLMGTTMLIGGYIFTKNQDILMGSFKFAVALTVFMTIIMVPIVLLNYIYTKLGIEEHSVREMTIFVSAMGVLLLIGGLVYRYFGDDLSKYAFMFAIDLTKFLTLLSIPIVLMGLLVKKGSLSDADKIAEFVMKCALVMVLGALFVKHTDLVKESLMFGAVFSLFLLMIIIPVAILGAVIKNEMGDAVNAIGEFVVKCSLIMLLGAWFVSKTKLVKNALMFGALLTLFIAMVLLPVVLFMDFVENDKTADFISSLSTMVISFSLILMVGGLFMAWGNGKYGRAAWEFAKLLAKFTAMMLVIIAFTTLLVNPFAILAVRAYKKMVTRFATLLIIGALFMMIPGFADSAWKFGLLLVAFTALMAIVLIVLAKVISKEAELKVTQFGVMVLLLSFALAVGGIVVNRIGLKPIIQFAVMLAIMGVAMFGFIKLMERVNPVTMLEVMGTVLLFSIAVGFLAAALFIAKYAMQGFKILDMIKFVACVGLLAVVFAIIGDPYVAAFVALGSATVLLMGVALSSLAIALQIVHMVMTGKEFGDLLSDIGKLSLVILALGGVFALIGGLSVLIIPASIAIGAMSIALVMFGAAMAVISFLHKHIDKYTEGLWAIMGVLTVISIVFAFIGLLSPAIAVGSIVIGMLSVALMLFAGAMAIINVVIGNEGIALSKKNMQAIEGLLVVIGLVFTLIGLLSPAIALGSIAIVALSVALATFAAVIMLVNNGIGANIDTATQVLEKMSETCIVLGIIFALIGLLSHAVALGSAAIIALSLALGTFAAVVIIINEKIGEANLEQSMTNLLIISSFMIAIGGIMALLGLLSPVISIGAVVLTLLSGALLLFDTALVGIVNVVLKAREITDGDLTAFGTKLSKFFDALEDGLPGPIRILKIIAKVAGITMFMNPLNHMIMMLGTAVKDFAELKVATAWDDKGNPTQYRQLTNSDFAAVVTNINSTIDSFMTGLEQVYDKHSDTIQEASNDGIFAVFFGKPKSKLLQTIRVAKMLAQCIGSVAENVSSIAQLMMPDDWNDEGKPIHFRPMTEADFTNAANGIAKILGTVGDALIDFGDRHPDWVEDFMKGDGGWFSAGSKFLAILKMCMGMGEMISSIAQGIKDYADLKIPEGYDEHGNAIGYRKLENKDFIESAENIKAIMEHFGKAIADGYDNGWSKAIKKEERLEMMFNSITKATNMLAGVAKTLQEISSLQFDEYDYYGHPTGKKVGLNYRVISDAAENIEDIMVCIPDAISDAYDRLVNVRGASLSSISTMTYYLKDMGEFISGIVQAIQDYANLRIPTKYNSEGKAIEFRPLKLDESLDTMTTNLVRITTGMGWALAQAYKAFASDPNTSPRMVEKMLDAMKPMGEVMSGLIGAIQAYADLKIPIYGKGKDGKLEIVDYVTFANGTSKDGKTTIDSYLNKVKENLIVIVKGLAGVMTDKDVMSTLTEIVNNPNYGKFNDAIKAVNETIGKVIENVSKYAELKIPKGELDKDGKSKKGYWVLSEMSGDDVINKIKEPLKNLIVAVPKAIVEAYEELARDPYFDSIRTYSGTMDRYNEISNQMNTLFAGCSSIMTSVFDIVTKFADLKIPKEYNKDGTVKSYVVMNAASTKELKDTMYNIISAVPNAIREIYLDLSKNGITDDQLIFIKRVINVKSIEIMHGAADIVTVFNEVKDQLKGVKINKIIGDFINNVAEMYVSLAKVFKNTDVTSEDIENAFKYINTILSTESLIAMRGICRNIKTLVESVEKIKSEVIDKAYIYVTDINKYITNKTITMTYIAGDCIMYFIRALVYSLKNIAQTIEKNKISTKKFDSYASYIENLAKSFNRIEVALSGYNKQKFAIIRTKVNLAISSVAGIAMKIHKFSTNDAAKAALDEIVMLESIAKVLVDTVDNISIAFNMLNEIPDVSLDPIEKTLNMMTEHADKIDEKKVKKLKSEAEALEKYVKVVNKISTDKVNSITKMFETMDSWSNSIGNLDEFVKALSDELATTLDRLTTEITEAKEVIKVADSQHAKRQLELNNSIEKIDRLMKQTLHVNVSQQKGNKISSAWEKPND